MVNGRSEVIQIHHYSSDIMSHSNGVVKTTTVESQLQATHLTSNGTKNTMDSAPSDEGQYTPEDIERHRRVWKIPASEASKRTLNPIRAIVDKLVIPTTVSKPLIPLSIGDPTVFGNLNPPESAITELTRLVKEGKSNGYAPSMGIRAAREAIAEKYNSPDLPTPLTPDDVMICSGASHALQIAMDACLNPGDNILLPKPGFSLYATIAGYMNVEVRYYDLVEERNWECDLEQAKKLVDSRTRCLLINNPSNPNGSNFSKEHLLEILKFAEEMKLVILSDEIYADMVFTGQTFYPIANLSKSVPIIAVGGLAKIYVVPGWRVGWLIWHDRHDRLKELKTGATMLTQIILGSNTLIQALIPNLLKDTPKEYYSTLNSTLEIQSLYLYDAIKTIPGLSAIKPQGAMYMMVRIDPNHFSPEVAGELDFCKLLLIEEMLFVLPGSCFLAHGYFRLVTCAPKFVMEEAVARLRRFCAAHAKEKPAV